MRFRIVIACAAAIAAGAVAGGPRVIGQDAPVPRPMMSAERTAAFVDAASRSLDYLPGEVIVKFKDGRRARRASSARSTRCAAVPRSTRSSGPARSPSCATRSQPDARILAEQLASQPEVVYAEPNYLRQHRRRRTTPATRRDSGTCSRSTCRRRGTSIPAAAPASSSPSSTPASRPTNTTRGRVATWNGSAIQIISVPLRRSIRIWPASRLVTPFDFVTTASAPRCSTPTATAPTSARRSARRRTTRCFDAGIAYNARIMPVKVCASYWDVQFAFSASGGRGFVPPDVRAAVRTPPSRRASATPPTTAPR